MTLIRKKVENKKEQDVVGPLVAGETTTSTTGVTIVLLLLLHVDRTRKLSSTGSWSPPGGQDDKGFAGATSPRSPQRANSGRTGINSSYQLFVINVPQICRWSWTSRLKPRSDSGPGVYRQYRNQKVTAGTWNARSMHSIPVFECAGTPFRPWAISISSLRPYLKSGRCRKCSHLSGWTRTKVQDASAKFRFEEALSCGN